MSKRTHIAGKLHSLGPIELKSNVVRMLILLVAFGFYMAFLSVSRTWIPVAQTEPAPTTPAEIDHQPIPKQNVVMTRDTDPVINGSVNKSKSDTVYVSHSPPEHREEYTAPTTPKTETNNQQSTPTPATAPAHNPAPAQPAADKKAPSTDKTPPSSDKEKPSEQKPGLLKAPGKILGTVLDELNRLI